MKQFRVFTINPGSTSTKIALFQGEQVLFQKNVRHDASALAGFAEVSDQLSYRKQTILNALREENISMEGVDAFSSRGGGLASTQGGVFSINDKLLEHARIGYSAKHPAILGSQLAHEFSSLYGGIAVIVNPPNVDEFDDVARITGVKGIYRQSCIHALNQKEIGIRYAVKKGTRYEALNLIITHIGGGVSVTAHRHGRMVDSNDIINGDGPMAPTRSGQLPVADVIKLCFSGEYTQRQLYDLATKSGGLVSHLGSSDSIEIRSRMDNGDRYAQLVYDAMIYQIGKEIGSCAAVLAGNVDGIILTGGIANDSYVVEKLEEMVSFVAPITVMAGEFEMEALAAGALRVLTGQEQALEYTGKPVWNGFQLPA